MNVSFRTILKESTKHSAQKKARLGKNRVAGWKGRACDEKACKQNCNNHGVCIKGECFCHDRWTGKACAADAKEHYKGVILMEAKSANNTHTTAAAKTEEQPRLNPELAKPRCRHVCNHRIYAPPAAASPCPN